MRNTLLFLFLTILSNETIAQSIEISFDTISQFVIIDTAANNTWQRGITEKCFFGNYWSDHKSMVTDTLNAYPSNNLSTFIFKFPFFVGDVLGFYLGIDMRLDADSLRDGGYVEYSIDNGSTWYNLREISSNPNLFTDTLLGGIYGATGIRYFDPCFSGYYCMTEGSGYPEFKFVFKSDSSDNHRCGWAIRSLYASIAICEGIEEINTNYHFASVFPNPVVNTSLLQINNENKKIISVEFFNSLGTNVKSFSNLHASTIQIPRKDFSNGVYLFRVQLADGKTDAGTFVVQ